MSSGIKKTISISVGDLCDFSARIGDLFSTSAKGPSSLEGIKGHQSYQNKKGKNWQKEVYVQQIISFENYQFDLKGRIDLLNTSVSPPIVEEIKTSYQSIDVISAGKKHLQLSQAIVYAYLYHLTTSETDELANEDTIYIIRATCFNLIDQDIQSEDFLYSAKELAAFVVKLLARYLDWYVKYIEHSQIAQQSAKQLTFPFAQYRQGQHYFAKAVYQTIKDRKQLIAQAPTGIGKTISVLFPAIKGLGEKLVSQIVYLTAKGSIQNNVAATVNTLQNSGLSIVYLVIQAKDRACPCRSENPLVANACFQSGDTCTRTIGFFDRLPEARKACLIKKDLTVENLQKLADKFHLCPFELSLQMARWSDLIICDFNYFLDPMVRLALFDDKPNKRVVLADEVHNLIDRSTAMYSAELSIKHNNQIIKALQSRSKLASSIHSLNRKLKRVNANANLIKSQIAPELIELNKLPKSILTALEKIFEAVYIEYQDAGLSSGINQQLPDGLTDWLKSLYRFYVVYELVGDAHAILAYLNQSAPSESTKVKLLCFSASQFIHHHISKVRATIGFSATLTPANYYRDLIGFEPTAKHIQLPSIFPTDHQLTIRCDFIDTRWGKRSNSITPLVSLINTTFNAKSGKYLAFFPSYDYLKTILHAFQQQFPHIKTIVQTANSNETHREEFLNAFFKSNDAVIGFAILGGIFAEGIDFKGSSLDGVIIVGTGMPQPTLENKLRANYFNSRALPGFEWIFKYPGLTRVNQTAGRVIRSEKERGVVVLVDQRFKDPRYESLFPVHWHLKPTTSIDEIKSTLKRFWHHDSADTR